MAGDQSRSRVDLVHILDGLEFCEKCLHKTLVHPAGSIEVKKILSEVSTETYEFTLNREEQSSKWQQMHESLVTDSIREKAWSSFQAVSKAGNVARDFCYTGRDAKSMHADKDASKQMQEQQCFSYNASAL